MTRPEIAQEVEAKNDAGLAPWTEPGCTVLLGYRYEKDGRAGAIGYCSARVDSVDGETLNLTAFVTEGHSPRGKVVREQVFELVPRRRDGVELPAWRPVSKDTHAATAARLWPASK